MARMTPMLDSGEDKKALRDTMVGHPDFMEHVPMFYNQYGGPIELTGMYRGASCFLVSNGPSVKDVDLELLKKPGVMIISVNNGASTLLKHGITPDFWTCVDQPCRFVKQIWLNPKIQKFVPTASFDKPIWDNEDWKDLGMNVKDCPNVVGFRRNEKFAGHRFFTESSFNWGCHRKYGGARTVFLPAMRIPFMLGFRRLYLVGVDLDMDDTKKYHFDEGRNKGAINCNNTTYKRIINEYGPQVKKHGEKLGYKILNCNPKSKLDCFDQISLEDAVSEITDYCGPTEDIQTRGMYTVWEDKKRMTREEAIEKTHK